MTRQRTDDHLATFGKLIPAISHEVSNLLQAIYGALSLALEESDLSVDTQSLLQIGHSETQRAIHYINQLRSLYIEDTEIKACCLREIVENVKQFLSEEIKNKNFVFELNIPPELPPIECKPGELQIALLEIILNLTKYWEESKSRKLVLDIQMVGFSQHLTLYGEGICIQIVELEQFLGLRSIRSMVAEWGGDVGLLTTSSGVCIWFSFQTS